MKRSLKTDIRHNANLVVTGGTAACHSYKLQCSQWRVICHGRDDVIKWKHFRVTGPLCGEFPAQMPVTRGFDIFFDLCLNKRFSKQSWGWWFKTPSCSSWRHCNDDNSEFSSWLVRLLPHGSLPRTVYIRSPQPLGSQSITHQKSWNVRRRCDNSHVRSRSAYRTSAHFRRCWTQGCRNEI